MEFMNCIPNLEAFIDKTIEKCLLEYDLNAHDTETVLDDLQRTQTPPMCQEKDVLKDCLENGQGFVVGTNQGLERKLLDTNVETGNDTLMVHSDSEIGEKLNSKWEELSEKLTNGKSLLVHTDQVNARSGSSSPDVSCGNSPFLKHPKLKSRLQQRYLEGHKESRDDTTTTEVGSKLPNNLDLLASAANIHEDSSSWVEEKQRIQVTQSLQAQSEGCLMGSNSRPCQKSPSVSTPVREVPLCTKLTSNSASPATPPPLLHHNDFNHVSGFHDSSLRITDRKLPSDTQTHKKRQILTSSNLPQSSSPLSTHDIKKAKRSNSYYQKSSNDLILHDNGVMRKRLSSPTAREIQGTEIQHRPTSSPQFNLSIAAQSNRSKSIERCNHLPTYSQRQHQDDMNSFTEPICYQESRIASIIAEELQKDNILNQDSVTPQSTISVARVDYMKPDYSSTKETRCISSQYCSSESSRQRPNSPPQTEVPKTSFSDSLVKKNCKTPPALNPPVLNSSSSTRLTKAKKMRVTGDAHLIPDNYNGMLDDYNPLDFIAKQERKTVQEDNDNIDSGFKVHGEDSVRRGYFSSPSLPLSDHVTARHLKSLASRMISLPSNKCSDNNSGSGAKNSPRKK